VATKPGITASRSSVKAISLTGLTGSSLVMVKVSIAVPPGSGVPVKALLKVNAEICKSSEAGSPTTASVFKVPVTPLVVLVANVPGVVPAET
jgi:hypothetical protein